MTLSQGDRLGRYEVLGPIGAGGMGEVWRARDTELDRDVAVKVLPESFASDANRLERFQREAKALAALSHPNLLDIYDVGTTDGLHYAVTELLEGDTLRERIMPSGLPWKKVTTIGAAVADGLAAAHGRGIIHRDLKPENLFLTADGRVKILDFGLASIHEEADADAETATITEAGTVMGTPGYMAPEQVKGKQADARSDIFSLGCVIYEMASGHRAFRGETGVEVIANILKEEPPQLSSSGASVPVDLERAVHRCLEKRPEARFQSAADLAYSLKSVGHSGSAPVMATPGSGIEATTGKKFSLQKTGGIAILLILVAITSWWALTQRGGEQPVVEPTLNLDPNRIAVVPFTNRTGDPTLDALGHRTADRIAQQLTEMEELEVVPPSTVASTLAAAKSKTLDSRTLVGDVTKFTLAGLVLTGVVDISGDSIEIQATLEDTITGRLVRSLGPAASARKDPSSAMALLADQSFIATSDHLNPSLTFGAGDDYPSLATYRAFRRQYRLLDRDHGFMDFVRLLEHEPNFTRLRLLVALGTLDGRGFRFADTLLSSNNLDETNLNRHQATIVLALQRWIQGNYEHAYRLFRDELDLSPRNLGIRHSAIRTALFANRPAAAVEIYGDLVPDESVPDGLNVFITTDTAVAYHLLGQVEEAIRLFESVRKVLPSSGMTDWTLILHICALGSIGDTGAIEQLIEEASSREFTPIKTAWARMHASHELRAHGFVDAAQEMIERAIADLPVGRLDPSDPWSRFITQARLETLLIGDRDQDAAELASDLDLVTDGWRSSLLLAGIAAARIGDIESARRLSGNLAELTNADLADTNHRVAELTLGRAMIAAQIGDLDESLELIRLAFTTGAERFDTELEVHEPRHNIFFEPLWDHPEFEEILQPKG